MLTAFCWLLVSGCKEEEPKKTDKEISSFAFLAAQNSALSEDVTGAISAPGSYYIDITTSVPFGTSKKGLVATFNSNATSVTVNNVAQVSGTTANDFDSYGSTIYKATAEDDSFQYYSVKVHESAPVASLIGTPTGGAAVVVNDYDYSKALETI